MKYAAIILVPAIALGVWHLFTKASSETVYVQEPTPSLNAPTTTPIIEPPQATSTPDTATSTQHEQPDQIETLPLPTPPSGASWHPSGGIARANCAAITDPDIQTICNEEVIIEKYIHSIVPSARITKGFCYPGTAYNDPKNWQQCTDLNNLQVETIHALKSIFESIVTHCNSRGIADCAIIVTGGSEFGHRGEVRGSDGSITCIDNASHCGGKKIDLRLTAGLESLITSEFTPLPNRDFDNAPQWVDPQTGYIYAREPTHWDILVP